MSRSRSVPWRRPERAFLDAALRALALTAAVALPLAAALAGREGVLGAAVGLAFVVVLLGLSALLHVLAAPLRRTAWLGLTLGGLALRLGLYAALILTLGDVAALHGTAVGLTAALGVVVGQVFEMRALGRARTLQVVQGPSSPGAGRPAHKQLEGVDR